MAAVVYLDAWALREVVSKKAADRRESARRFARLKSGAYAVKVPHAIIGEAVATVMRDYGPGEWEETVGRIMQAVGSVADPGTCFPPPEPDAAELARRMMAHVKGMTRTDALLAAQALLDPVSQKLVTRDSLLTNSAWLEEEERRMRRDGKRSVRLNFDPHL